MTILLIGLTHHSDSFDFAGSLGTSLATLKTRGLLSARTLLRSGPSLNGRGARLLGQAVFTRTPDSSLPVFDRSIQVHFEGDARQELRVVPLLHRLLLADRQ